MKKLLILIAAVLIFTGCDDKLNWSTEYDRIVPENKTALSASTTNTTKIGDVADIYSFEYKGHKYIMFNTSNGLFVIIDPDDEK